MVVFENYKETTRRLLTICTWVQKAVSGSFAGVDTSGVSVDRYTKHPLYLSRSQTLRLI